MNDSKKTPEVPKIGWRRDGKGGLVPVDEAETARWSEAVGSLRQAFLERWREAGYLPPQKPNIRKLDR
jgi:hypothetical protein